MDGEEYRKLTKEGVVIRAYVERRHLQKPSAGFVLSVLTNRDIVLENDLVDVSSQEPLQEALQVLCEVFQDG